VRRERGQAALELISAVAFVVLPVVLAAVQLQLIARGEERAQRIADQAAVLAFQHRPIPAELRRDAQIEVTGGRVHVRVPVTVVWKGGTVDVEAEARLP
jgi:hypothetical protein